MIFDHAQKKIDMKLPTIWTDGKAQLGRSSDMEEVRNEKIRHVRFRVKF